MGPSSQLMDPGVPLRCLNRALPPSRRKHKGEEERKRVTHSYHSATSFVVPQLETDFQSLP